VSKTDVINFYMESAKEMAEFEELQLQEIQKTVEEIGRKDSFVQATCLEACRKSYKEFLKNNRIESEEDENNKRGHLIGDNSNRKMEFTQMAAKSTH